MKSILTIAFAGFAAALSIVPCRGGDFVSASIFDTPDGLHLWNSSDPEATEQSLGVSLAADFVRGLVLTGPRTGWYTVVFRESGPDLTGFYRLENGVSTRIAPLPYRTPEAWGLTFSADRSHLYYVADQNWTTPAVPYRLYRLDFDGTFTEIAPLAVPGVADPELRGLTLSPLDGQLYSYEATTDVLFRIDPSNGAVTVIGPMGLDCHGSGGLAFSPDGSELLLCCDSGIVRRVDPATGQTTAATGLPFPTSALTAAPPALPGDLDENGCVDLADLALLLADFGCSGACAADVNDDGQTNLADLGLLLANFGTCN
jgi:hypothetical protein